MKWEEAMQELNKIIPQDAGYFTLQVEQFWHGEVHFRSPKPDVPTVKVCVNKGPNGVWKTFEAPTLKAMVDQIRVAYEPKVAAPDAIEVEAAEIVESGEGLATEEVLWPPETMKTVDELNKAPDTDDEPF